ncbi:MULTISPECIES: DUF262 domain-containing protein [Corynebacterium]|uniref:DUF262 domain-containing protein n=1 Tax=Corynebacterium aurimucosum TaxID=169292 RepID=A0A6I3K9W9_9CORY|nr:MULTISPECIES: DUF262 domain-containing protein [Corynebacterium]MTD90860.1 DUF262 domain-containing protein [Corynebacterium aurimucosum]OFN78696.1 hypothetical protein HMPREF2526_02065 [Corynebacterium sp. HMSC070E08]OFO98330.1 hypothetical protein HMPREF3009_02965 [Corynebacterium sp. HMSC034H07]
MQFEAVSRPLQEILIVGQHVIPRYQRRYAWDELNIEEFWNDLRSNQQGHFLGSMVVCGPRSGEMEIIDGQQRITTALILLSVLRDEYIRLEETALVGGIEPLIKYVDLNGKERFRLENRDSSANDRLVESVLTPEKKRQYPNGQYLDSLEVAARNKFEALIHAQQERTGDSVSVLNEMRDSLVKAEAVYVWADSRRDAFGVFETLNDRGQSLTVVDLVKNTILSRLAERADRGDDKMWAKAIDLVEQSELDNIDLNQFLYYHWNSIAQNGAVAGEPVEEKKIRRSVEEFLEGGTCSEESAKFFLEEFLRSAYIFEALGKTLTTGGAAEPWKELSEGVGWHQQKFDKIAWALYGVLVSGAAQPFMLLLALMRKYLEKDGWMKSADLIAFLQEIKNYQFRWSIAGKGSTSTHRRLYRKAATMVYLAENAGDLRAAMQEFQIGASKKGATDHQFKAGLGKLVYSNSRRKDVHKIRYILREIETNKSVRTLDFSKLQTIEHIEPQANKSENTPRNSWVFKLGNLMLLPGEVNSTLPNGFADKAPILAKYTGAHDNVLLQAVSDGAWGNELAGKRQEAIEDYACVIWPKAKEID